MKVGRYVGDGRVAITEDPTPTCPVGGLLVQTEACGLCSGELMAWYMDQKVPHVLGHEVAGIVRESQDSRFPVGARVFPHHHAPCLRCPECERGRFVHCSTWRRTKLAPGGMAETFAVAPENLADTLVVDDLSARAAALIEPLACVAKSLRLAGRSPGDGLPLAVIGLGVMGLMHALVMGASAVGFDLSPDRRAWATAQGVDARPTEDPADGFETVVVCPGSQSAFDASLARVRPGGTVVLFAPLPPGEALRVPQEVYFRDLRIVHTYSCGPDDTLVACGWLREGRVRPEHVVSHFITLDDLPEAYRAMKAGEILKPMVEFGATVR